MLGKKLLHTALSSIRKGGLDVTYWDGEQQHYGPEPAWVTVRFTDPNIAKALRKNLELAIGEGYMTGAIEVDGDLAQLARLGDANRVELDTHLPYMVRKAARSSAPQAQFSEVQHHYDIGNDFYRLWLDPSMTYSCAYFKKPTDSLTTAQRQKVDHVLRKLHLQPGQRLLDIGSGWGELILRAATDYGVTAHGITLSKEQLTKTQERINGAGLTKQVTVELQHYDNLQDSNGYDRIVSVGMYEHVGRGNHARYMAAIDRLLKPGGVSLLHTITQFHEQNISPWIDKYIFPGGYLPTLEDTVTLLSQHDFHTVDVESLRRHYARTLDEWAKGFEANTTPIQEMFDEQFVRMWRLYLRGSYAGFAFGNLDLMQILFTKGLSDEYPMTRDHVYAG